MNKMLGNKLCSRLLDGNMTDHKNYISGTCKGFYVTVNTTANGMFSFQISAHSEDDPENAALREFLESYKSTNKQIQSVKVYHNSVTIVSTRTFLAKKIPAHLNEAIMPVIDFLVNHNYLSGCMQCGTQDAQIECYEINGVHHYLCESCVSKTETELFDRKQEILSRKSKLLPGIVGALLGSMIGCLVYFLLWQIGYIAAAAGLVTAICAFKGYAMLGGVVDKKGVFACILVMIFAVFFANQLVWAYDAYSVYKEEGFTFFECFRLLRQIIALSDLTGAYYGNLAIAYILTAVGSLGSIINVFKSSTGSYKVKKMQ